MNLEQAFGTKFQKDVLRTRQFELNGHTFKVRVPLVAEMDAILKAMQTPDQARIEQHYKEFAESFLEDKDQAEKAGVVFKDNDVIVAGRSLLEAATTKSNTESRILAMFKLLVPEEQGFDMNTITYQMIDELFPFAIQLEIMDGITKTISPDYKTNRGK